MSILSSTPRCMLVGLIILLMASFAHANMVNNGYFNYSTSGTPNWWSTGVLTNPTPAGTTAWEYQTSGGNPGAYVDVANTDSTGGKYWQSNRIAIQPDMTYTVGFDYMASADGAWVRVEMWKDQNWTFDSRVEITDSPVTNGIGSLTMTETWKSVAKTFTSSNTAKYVTIRLLNGATTGSASFDNVTMDLAPTPEPASLALLGLGGGVLLYRRRSGAR